MGTECEFVGIRESATLLGVTPQRANQLKPKLGPKAGIVASGPLWLKDQVETFAEAREETRNKHMGIPNPRGYI